MASINAERNTAVDKVEELGTKVEALQRELEAAQTSVANAMRRQEAKFEDEKSFLVQVMPCATLHTTLHTILRKTLHSLVQQAGVRHQTTHFISHARHARGPYSQG